MSAPKAAAKAAPDAKHEDGDAKPKSGGMSKLLIGVFVSMVIIAETGVFFFLVPTGEDVAALAESRLIENIKEKEHESASAEPEAGGGGHGAKPEKAHSAKDGDKIVEFPLGLFSPTFTPAGSDRNCRVELELFGTVKQKNLEKLKELHADRVNRFKMRMMLEIRNATMDELSEIHLGLLQRRILATSTEVLGEDLLLSVGFGEYQVIEE